MVTTNTKEVDLMRFLNQYLKLINRSHDVLFIQSEVHKMAMVIAAPNADPCKDPLVAVAFEMMAHLVARIEHIEELERKASNDY
jgi:hypothetical protein